jgi:hypothetical protein
MSINMNDLIQVGEKLYREINPDSKMNVPSMFFESLEPIREEWLWYGKVGETLYKYCKTKPQYANTFTVLPEDFRDAAATLLKEADTDTVLRIMKEEFDVEAIFNKQDSNYRITPEDAQNLGLDKENKTDSRVCKPVKFKRDV